MTTAADGEATYVAFLRGINVGGHNRLAMDALRELAVSLGWRDVRTFGQSGNVVFVAPSSDADALGDDLAAAIADGVGYDVRVMARSRSDLEAVVAGQPFEPPADDDVARYVTFLARPAPPDATDRLAAAAHDAETFRVAGWTVYSRLHRDRVPSGRFTDVGAVLDVPATRRRWRVVERVATMAAD